NMKTAVEAIFIGKARQYNRRFLQMCSHHLIEPVACSPASGWEKGQVENQVGNLRDQLFRPKPRVSSLAELNGWLEDQCVAYAKRTRHPEFKDRTIWEVFEEERPSLMERRAPFDGFVEKAVRATTTCLITADHNRYSVDARAVTRTRGAWEVHHATPSVCPPSAAARAASHGLQQLVPALVADPDAASDRELLLE